MRDTIRSAAFVVASLGSPLAFAQTTAPGVPTPAAPPVASIPTVSPVAPPAPPAPPEPSPTPSPSPAPVPAPDATPPPREPPPAWTPYPGPPAYGPYPSSQVQLPPTEADLSSGSPGPSRVRVRATTFALELDGSLDVSARFPKSEAGRTAEDIADAGVGLGGWFGTRKAVYGISVERVGLGKDLYATNTNGETFNASYLVDTLWLAGRWYFTDDRPAFYLSIAAGPALPHVRAAGTRASADALVVPPESYQCSRAGKVGAGIAGAAGTEFDIAESWSILGEARLSGHFMSAAGDAFSGCAPGTGPAVVGALRLGVSYRFGGG